jgi:hypothetical protein
MMLRRGEASERHTSVWDRSPRPHAAVMMFVSPLRGPLHHLVHHGNPVPKLTRRALLAHL